MVRGLLISVLNSPPIIDSVESAVCGINLPKTIVAPMNGAQSSHVRAYTIVEKPQIRFFSAHTSSVVHVVKMANVDDIATFDTIDASISKATRRFVSTDYHQNATI